MGTDTEFTPSVSKDNDANKSPSLGRILYLKFWVGPIARIQELRRLCGRAIRLLKQGNYYLFLYRINQRINSVPAAGRLCDYFEQVLYRRAARNLQLQPRPDVVNILVPSFFDAEGKNMYCGGGERYLIELNRIIRKLGYEPAVYQSGSCSWMRWYNDLCVQGIPCIPSAGDQDLLNREFHYHVPPGALTIYFAFSLAYPFVHPDSLGISHGIWWDQAIYQHPKSRNGSILRRVLNSIRNCKNMVSVDTNTINWLRTVDADQSGKMTYIPNFADVRAFAPAYNRPERENIVILYPRRLYSPRGFWLVAELIPYFCRKYPNVEFHFVGKGDPPELKRVNQLIKQHPGRVSHYHLEPEDMHKAYEAADITLIPTVASEGTSLSCIEAMASGNAVIASDVGGLTDLIINEHNGLLVSPKTEQIKQAIEKLICDPQLRQRVRRNAREVSKCFSLQSWRSRWEQYLSEVLPPRRAIPCNLERCWLFLHPSTPDITWQRAKQRPQHLLESLSEFGQHAFFMSDRESNGYSDDNDSVSKQPYLHLLESEEDAYFTNPVIYIYYAYLYPKLQKWPKRKIIYDISDDPAIHAESSGRQDGNPHNYLYYHEKLLNEADVVMTSSAILYERYREKRPDILLAPNAVTIEDFAGDFAQRPADLPPKPSKIIGYYGAIAEWFDFDLFESLLRQRPEYQFVLMGLTNCPNKIRELLAKYPNARYLGEKPYKELPGYLAHFDAAIIPFVLNDVTHAVSPVKLFEYMAGKKPVVSTDIFECRKYEPVLIAKNAEQFASQLDLAISLGQDENFKEQLYSCALANTWKERAGQILEALEASNAKNRRRAAQPAELERLLAVS